VNNLLRHIREHNPDGLHSGVIIGAGNGGQLPAWRRLGCGQLLLAEAHPRQAEELSRRLREGERLLAVAITADEQPMATLLPTNNLAFSSLNAATRLVTHYPNLRTGEALQVPARSLGQILAEEALDEQQVHLLLIAAPGQAMQLLQRTPPAALHAFTWLLVECTSEPLYDGDADASDISSVLKEVGYDLISSNPDVIYPQSQLLFKRNLSVVERLRLSGQVVELRSELARTAQSSQQQIAIFQQQAQKCDAALREHTRLSNEKQNEINILTKENAALTAARDEQIKLVIKCRAQIDALSNEASGLVAACDALAKEKNELIESRDEQSKLASERQAQIDGLSKEKSELTAACDALGKEKTELIKSRDEQSKSASERRAQIDVLSKEKSELTAARNALAKERTDLIKSRDEQNKLASERQAQIDALSKGKTELTATCDTLTEERTELIRARDEQTKLASERKTQLDKITAERDQTQKSTADQKKTLDDAQKKIKMFENEANASLQRQQMLQEELIKTEAQIELIKDLLLRESGL